MNYNLFLDDFRDTRMAFLSTRYKAYAELDWTIVRDYSQFTSYIIKHGVPAMVSFDHDLGFEHYDLKEYTDFLTWDEYYLSPEREMTGYDCAKWLCDYCLENDVKFPRYLIHSANPVGSNNIDKYIQNFLKHNPNLK